MEQSLRLRRVRRRAALPAGIVSTPNAPRRDSSRVLLSSTAETYCSRVVHRRNVSGRLDHAAAYSGLALLNYA